MFKSISNSVWAYDLEWVPDPVTGRRVYNLPDEMPDVDVVNEMYLQAGATEENPHPFLKIVLCRIVSIGMVLRSVDPSGKVKLALRTLPNSAEKPLSEAEIIDKFLEKVGEIKPQLVGYNSASADIRILIQRGIAQGVQASNFCKRPNKPWEGVDYFAKDNIHIDLMDVISAWGSRPSLHEFACACGIPGKLDTSGNEVATLWQTGKYQEIINYNETDAITTYLAWLQTAFFSGFFTPEKFEYEKSLVMLLLDDRIQEGKTHLLSFKNKWLSMQD